MEILTPTEVKQLAEKSVALPDDVIETLNTLLVEGRIEYINGGFPYTCIHMSDLPTTTSSKYNLKQVAKHLKDKGWNASYKKEQRDGEWINVDFYDQ